MKDLKIGGAQFEDVDRIQLNKADITGVVNFMESGDFMDVMQRPYRMSSTKKTLYENQYLTTLGDSGATFLADFTTAYLSVQFDKNYDGLSILNDIPGN